MSLKRTKGKETRKSRIVGKVSSGRPVSGKVVLASRNVTKLARTTAPKVAVKTTLKSPVHAVKVAAVKPDTKPIAAVKPDTKPIAAVKPAAAVKLGKIKAAKAALTEVKGPPKPERIHSHPTMCLHCHLIVEMYHERGADPVKGAWQCPRCGHKYLFSHWKIKRQARGKPEAA